MYFYNKYNYMKDVNLPELKIKPFLKKMSFKIEEK